MKINVSWTNNEQTILHYKFANGWSWLELRDIFVEGHAMLDKVNHPVYLIMDFTESKMFAPSGAINQSRHVLSNPKHEKVASTVVVGSNFVSSLYNIISRITGNTDGNWDVAFVNTLDEAYQFIDKQQAHQKG